MPALISLKKSLFMFLGGLICAVGTAFLINFILSGPKLGGHYDFLLKRKPPPDVSREILVIKTDEYVEGSDLFTVLMTLTEMDAGNLIQAGRVSPLSSPITLTENEIRRRFTDEYVLVGSNIRKLFEGIRMGSVTPREAPAYVERVVELTEYGRDRLLAALVDRDEDLIRSVSVFGNYNEVDTGPLFDRDGKIRRVKPVDTQISFEHPVYQSLKSRFVASQIETSGLGDILWLRRADGSEVDIVLDRNGNAITPWNCDFRSVDITLFREYEEAQRKMRTALAAADKAGAFSQTYTEQSPLFHSEYSLILRNELLRAPNADNRLAWRAACANFLKSLDDFLSSSAERNIVNGYEKLIADADSLNRAQFNALTNMKEELIQSFALMRDEYKKLSAVRSRLEEETTSSFCIIGAEQNAHYSALLANVLITGSHTNPVYDRYVLFWSIMAAFFILIIIFMLRPSILLIVGVILSFLAAIGFSCYFVFYSHWIDPLIALGASLAGTIVVFICKCVYLQTRIYSFRAAYGTAVSKEMLTNLINTGRPQLSEINVAFAAVIAVKDINLLTKENREKTYDAGKARKAFFAFVKKTAFNARAVIAGYEGDTILVCFGSPLDNAVKPVAKACTFVRELLSNKQSSIRAGIDAGECTFLWSPETGFSVNGRPVVRAKILVSKTTRFNSLALITDAVREKISFDGKQAGVLYNENDAFYEFPL